MWIQDEFLGECNYITFALRHEPSVCRLSVTLLHPRQRRELFANISAPADSSGTLAVVLNFLEKISRDLGDRAS